METIISIINILVNVARIFLEMRKRNVKKRRTGARKQKTVINNGVKNAPK